MTAGRQRSLIDDAPWAVPDMKALYLDVYEEMFHEEPPVNAEGLRPKESWRCSSLGRCMRFQVLERSGRPKPAIDARGRRVMDIGSQLHWIYGLEKARFGLLLGKEIAVADPELSLTGHLDILWGGPVQDIPDKWRLYRKPDWIFFLEELRRRERERWGDAAPVTIDELKTVSGWGFSNLGKDGRTDYQFQLAGYDILARRHPDAMPAAHERAQVVVFNRESGATREIAMKPSWVSAAEERLGQLNEAWTTGNWPICTCGTGPEDMLWQRNYCAFQNESGDGCCDTSLLDLLEASIEGTT
jgi:hypothetical protein